MRQKDFLAICAVGSREEVELAIKRGADVNKKAYIYGAKVPPLFVAVMEENEEAIKVLLEHGAKTGEGFILDIALIYALVSFVTTTVLSRIIIRRDERGRRQRMAVKEWVEGEEEDEEAGK